jgi:hypothetical protein
MKLFSAILSFLVLGVSSTLQAPLTTGFPPQAVVGKPDPRLVMYVQTFTTPDKKPLSLLPLLEHETKVTHIILASMHLHEKPGEMRLNKDAFESPVNDVIWDEVKTLQKNGIKVMVLLGGAAAGSYKRLNGTEAEV